MFCSLDRYYDLSSTFLISRIICSLFFVRRVHILASSIIVASSPSFLVYLSRNCPFLVILSRICWPIASFVFFHRVRHFSSCHHCRFTNAVTLSYFYTFLFRHPSAYKHSRSFLGNWAPIIYLKHFPKSANHERLLWRHLSYLNSISQSSTICQDFRFYSFWANHILE